MPHSGWANVSAVQTVRDDAEQHGHLDGRDGGAERVVNLEVTATRWAHRTNRDWHTYLAQRRRDTNDPTPRTYTGHVFE
jgi:hypothetical protein